MTVVAAAIAAIVGCSGGNGTGGSGGPAVGPVAQPDAAAAEGSAEDASATPDTAADAHPSTPDAGGDGCQPLTCAGKGENCGLISNGCGGDIQCGTCASGNTCGASTPNVCGCTPTTCATQGAHCGSIPDGCGNMLNCGSCTAPATCGGSGTAGQCGCTTTSCAAVGADCGTMPDGCGGTVSCGTCTVTGQTCGGGGTSNVCGAGPCVPKTCGSACGTISDGCGGTLACGGCTGAHQTCGGGGVANQCGCTKTTCAAAGATCGTISDGCGGTLSCGNCNAPQTCGGGSGGANVCGCTPESGPALCAAAGATCGALSGNDNCGLARTVASCGTCGADQVCGTAGAPNTCTSTTEPADPICSAKDGFCWGNPLPQGNHLRASVTLPSGDQWLSGADGTVLHWNGARWSGTTALATVDFYSIFATSNSDVWVGGYGGAMLHYDGATWSPVASGTTGTIRGLWGTSASQIWAAADDGVHVWNGSAWTMQSATPGVLAIEGTSASDVWAVGHSVIVHYDGHAWTQTTSVVPYTLTGVWASSPTDAWAVGTGLMRWNGVSWQDAGNSIIGNAVYGTSATDAWISAAQTNSYHWDGLAWSQVALDGGNAEGLGTVTGDGHGMVLMAGRDGTMYRLVGGAWRRVSGGGVLLQAGGLRRLAVTSTMDLFAAGCESTSGGDEGLVVRIAPSGVSPVLTSSPPDCFFGLSASSSSNVWAVGRTVIEGYDGATWSSAAALGASPELDEVVALSPTDVWAAGADYIQHYDGQSWTLVANPLSGTQSMITALGGNEGGDVWAGANDGSLLRKPNGGSWTAVTSPTTTEVLGIASPQSGFAVVCAGDGAHVWNGSAWSTGPAGVQCNAVYATAPTDAWMVTYSATTYREQIFHYNGAGWTEMAPGVVGNLIAVDIGGAGGTVWVLGQTGQLLHRP